MDNHERLEVVKDFFTPEPLCDRGINGGGIVWVKLDLMALFERLSRRKNEKNGGWVTTHLPELLTEGLLLFLFLLIIALSRKCVKS